MLIMFIPLILPLCLFFYFINPLHHQYQTGLIAVMNMLSLDLPFLGYSDCQLLMAIYFFYPSSGPKFL